MKQFLWQGSVYTLAACSRLAGATAGVVPRCLVGVCLLRRVTRFQPEHTGGGGNPCECFKDVVYLFKMRDDGSVNIAIVAGGATDRQSGCGVRPRRSVY